MLRNFGKKYTFDLISHKSSKTVPKMIKIENSSTTFDECL